MNFHSVLKGVILLVLAGILTQCHYAPFIKYFNQNRETSLPNFNKKALLVGAQSELRTAYDLTMYDWYIKPDPEKRTIEGQMKIEFVGKLGRKTILLDLQSKLKIDELIADYPLESFEHKGDLLYVTFDDPLVIDKTVLLDIKYHGKPVIIAKEGPIQWREDLNGKPWISTQTEGIGAHFMMPCKLLLYDEPERCIIRVEVANDLMAVANGRLDSITEKSNAKIYHHSVLSPINIYNISFNIGDFVKIEKSYTDVDSTERTVQIFPLKQDQDTANVFYENIAMIFGHTEDLFGGFPWWRDGCKFIQSTLGRSAMEHQSALSMGSIYYNDFAPSDKVHVNLTVIHELAHEWWGNLITANDYCDIWIHEGMASYAELLVVEKIYGKGYYNWLVNRMAKYIKNERPVIKTCDVLYNSWVNRKDQDIYEKGALTMHTLRTQLQNDSLFFSTIRKATEHFAGQNITTAQFEGYFNESFNQNFDWLFDIYLRNTEVPTIAYTYDSLNSQLNYQWSSSVPNQERLKLFALNSEDELIALNPSSNLQTLQVTKGEKELLTAAYNGYVIFKELE